MKPVYVTNNPHEKAMQRALIQYRNPKNYELVKEALHLAHRTDLIGFEPKCLIRPKHNGQQNRNYQNHGRNNGTTELHIRKSGKQSVTCTRKNRNNWIFQADKMIHFVIQTKKRILEEFKKVKCS